MLTTFLALTIQAITAKQQSVVLNVNNDTTCNHTTEATFINTHSRQNTFRFNSIERQEYENIYSNNNDLTQASAVAGQDIAPSSISTQHSTKQEERLEHLQQQLLQLQQKFNDMTSKASEFTNATMHNQQSPQQTTMIEDKIIILADKIHDIETQIVAKQQQDIDAIKHQLSQQEGNHANQLLQAEQVANSIITQRQAPLIQQINELKDSVNYLQNALQKTIDRIAKVFSLFKTIIKNYNNQNYA